MDAVLEKLLESPKLALYLRQIEGVLEREKVARQQFYKDLRDDVKAEFINGEIVVHSPVKKIIMTVGEDYCYSFQLMYKKMIWGL
jgi:hypothetical protein